MKRHTLALLALAAGLTGPAVLPSAAAGPACVTYTDASGDADGEDTLDLVSLELNNTATDLVATIGVKKLAANPATSPGYGFTVNYTLNEMKFVHSFFKYGVGPMDAAIAAAGDSNRTTINGTTAAIPVTATFDTAKSLVTLKVKLAEIEAFSTVPWFDARLSAISAVSADDAYVLAADYDTLKAPEEATYRIRYGCGPDVVDPGNPAKPPHFVTQDVAPRAACFARTDGKTDAKPAVNAQQVFPNEPSLDLTGINVNVTPTDLKAYLHVDKLAAAPSNFAGDRYEFSFGYGRKQYTLAVGRLPSPFETSPPFVVQTRGQVNGTTNATLKPTGTFNTAGNYVVISIAREKLETVNGGPIPLGTYVTNVTARTWALQPGLQFVADTSTNPADTKLVLGNSACFAPPAALLAAEGATPTVQFGDAAPLRVKLTSEDGTALGGKTVTFTFGGKTASATTSSAGVATAAITGSQTAGAHTFTAAFKGDSANGPATVSLPVTVTTEVTKITLSVVKNKTARTVTATLKDDDGKPVAGQTVTWTVNGKSAGSGRTDALGRVVLKTAKPTQTVVAKYAGATGTYAASQASAKV